MTQLGTAHSLERTVCATGWPRACDAAPAGAFRTLRAGKIVREVERYRMLAGSLLSLLIHASPVLLLVHWSGCARQIEHEPITVELEWPGESNSTDPAQPGPGQGGDRAVRLRGHEGASSRVTVASRPPAAHAEAVAQSAAEALGGYTSRSTPEPAAASPNALQAALYGARPTPAPVDDVPELEVQGPAADSAADEPRSSGPGEGGNSAARATGRSAAPPRPGRRNAAAPVLKKKSKAAAAAPSDAVSFAGYTASEAQTIGSPNAADALLYGDGLGGGSHDLSSPPRLGGYVYWDCPWPETSSTANIDRAVVHVTVDVTVDGKPAGVELVDEDPGFGPYALRCALDHRYIPGRDALGHPAPGRTRSFGVRFTRVRGEFH